MPGQTSVYQATLFDYSPFAILCVLTVRILNNSLSRLVVIDGGGGCPAHTLDFGAVVNNIKFFLWVGPETMEHVRANR